MTLKYSSIIQLFSLSCLISIAWARVGFIKDQSLDKIEFPPRTLQVFHSGVPTGHLRPLGWQRKPDGRVKETSDKPTPKEFHDEYVKQLQPIVFRSLITDSPALKLWEKDDYLKKNYGYLDIHVVVKKELFKSGPKRMSFKTFLKEYLYEDWYLSEVVPAEMMQELSIPKPLKCGMTSTLMESGMWMSSGGTDSLLHSHADHNLHCVLSGRKDFILIDSKYKDNFDYEERDAHPGCGASKLDMDRLNMYKYKKIAETPWIWSTLRTGDCIYIPAKHLHQVRSYGRSFSSTYLWAPAPAYDFQGCEKVKLDDPLTLNEVPFMWTYANGAKQLSNARLNAVSLLHHLVVNTRNEPTLRFEVFEEFYDDVMANADESSHETALTVWSWLSNTRREIPREELKKLPQTAMEKVATEFNKAYQVKHDEL